MRKILLFFALLSLWWLPSAWAGPCASNGDCGFQRTCYQGQCRDLSRAAGPCDDAPYETGDCFEPNRIMTCIGGQCAGPAGEGGICDPNDTSDCLTMKHCIVDPGGGVAGFTFRCRSERTQVGETCNPVDTDSCGFRTQGQNRERLYCDKDSVTCKLPSNCGSNNLCPQGLVCNIGKCAPPGMGFPCDAADPDSCQSGLVCMFGICAPPGTEWQYCDVANMFSCRHGLICTEEYVCRRRFDAPVVGINNAFAGIPGMAEDDAECVSPPTGGVLHGQGGGGGCQPPDCTTVPFGEGLSYNASCVSLRDGNQCQAGLLCASSKCCKNIPFVDEEGYDVSLDPECTNDNGAECNRQSESALRRWCRSGEADCRCRYVPGEGQPCLPGTCFEDPSSNGALQLCVNKTCRKQKGTPSHMIQSPETLVHGKILCNRTEGNGEVYFCDKNRVDFRTDPHLPWVCIQIAPFGGSLGDHKRAWEIAESQRWCGGSSNKEPPSLTPPAYHKHGMGQSCDNAPFPIGVVACDTGLFCNGQNKCETLHAEGQYCDRLDMCQTGLCDLIGKKCVKIGPSLSADAARRGADASSGAMTTTTTPPARPAPPPPKKGKGEACSVNTDCQTNICRNNKCMEKKILVGDDCSDPNNFCSSEAGLVCDNNRCKFDINKGPCTSGDQCKSGADLVCRAGLCVLRSGAGGVCATTNDCQSGLTCNNLICQTPPREMGETCNGGMPCKSGLVCTPGFGGRFNPESRCVKVDVSAGGDCGTYAKCLATLECQRSGSGNEKKCYNWNVPLEGSCDNLYSYCAGGGQGLAECRNGTCQAPVVNECYANWIYKPPPFQNQQVECNCRTECTRKVGKVCVSQRVVCDGYSYSCVGGGCRNVIDIGCATKGSTQETINDLCRGR